MLKEVIKRRAYEGIVEQIRGLIEKGKMKRGDQLPNERELSDTFKVSRATVREAILSLETMNLVDRRQGNGTYVIASSEEALIKPLAASLFLEKDDLIDIFALRKIIEPEVAQLASENAAPEEIEELERIIKEQEMAAAGSEHAVHEDTIFHHQLARMSKNRILERLLLALFDLMSKTREEYLQSEERIHKSLRGHQDILAAIKTGKGAATRQAMRKHLDDVESILFKKKRGGGKKSQDQRV